MNNLINELLGNIPNKEGQNKPDSASSRIARNHLSMIKRGDSIKAPMQQIGDVLNQKRKMETASKKKKYQKKGKKK